MSAATDGTTWKAFEGECVDNKYYLQQLLGSGGFGGVFLASEVVNGQELRRVAVKLIVPDPQIENRQMQELIAAAQFDDPHLIRCFVSGVCAVKGYKFLYLVSEIANYSLRDRLDRGPLSVDEAREFVTQVASGLRYLHEAAEPRVHRDLKPANILRVGAVWKLADFGLVRNMGKQAVCNTTELFCSPPYAPPEAFAGNEVSTSWDMWSLGAVMAEALSGERLFKATDTVALQMDICRNPIYVPASVPPPFDQIVAGCLVRDRAARWTARNVLDALSQRVAPSTSIPLSVGGQETRGGPWLLAAAAVVLLVVLLGLGSVVYYRRALFPAARTPGQTTRAFSGAPGPDPSLPTVVPNNGAPRPVPSDRTPPAAAPVVIPPPPREPVEPNHPLPPPTVAFTSSAEAVTKGASVKLVWEVEGASDVRLDGEAVTSRGSRTVTPEATRTYELLALGGDNAAAPQTRSVTIQVSTAPRAEAALPSPAPAPVIVSPRAVPPVAAVRAPSITVFESVPKAVDQCGVVVLRWTVSAATAVTIEPDFGPVSTTGYRMWRPLHSGRYTLTAIGPGGRVDQTQAITVAGGPRHACSQ